MIIYFYIQYLCTENYSIFLFITLHYQSFQPIRSQKFAVDLLTSIMGDKGSLIFIEGILSRDTASIFSSYNLLLLCRYRQQQKITTINQDTINKLEITIKAMSNRLITEFN